MATVYIGLGSNLDNPQQQLKQAFISLRQLVGILIINDSGVFKSRAMTLNNERQPDYYNAVVKLETRLPPHELLDALQAIENQQGRVREYKWSPRTLDLDILLYDDLQLNDERLTIPHPGIAERAFVLYPLQRIENDLDIPEHGKLSNLLEHVSSDDVEYIGVLQ